MKRCPTCLHPYVKLFHRLFLFSAMLGVEHDDSSTPANAKHIEKEFKLICKQNLPFERIEVPVDVAEDIFKDSPLKLGILRDFSKEDHEQEKRSVSLYRVGDFVDLCSGPHIPSTAVIRAIDVRNVSAVGGGSDSTTTYGYYRCYYYHCCYLNLY